MQEGSAGSIVDHASPACAAYTTCMPATTQVPPPPQRTWMPRHALIIAMRSVHDSLAGLLCRPCCSCLCMHLESKT